MISQLSAKYQFGAIHTAHTTDGKVTNLALLSTESEKVYRLYMYAHYAGLTCGAWVGLVLLVIAYNLGKHDKRGHEKCHTYNSVN